MLKWLAMMVAALVGVAVVGQERPEAAPKPTPGDVLFLRSEVGVTLIRELPHGEAVRLPRGVPAPDWSAVARTIPRGQETQVVVLDPRSGRDLWSRNVPGKLEIEVAASGGRLVALGPRGAVGGYGEGRSTTTLFILGADDPQPRTVELKGNFQPEAFSTDGDSLFVVEYLPPLNPTQYRVRRLDLATGEVGGVYTVDAELQEAMQGTARIQAASPDGGRLYTLYTIRDGHGAGHTFVHVLSLDEEWAHCVDLPPEFAAITERSVVLSVAPGGDRLYVADTSAGAVAEIDTRALAVTRTARVSFEAEGSAAHAVSGPDGAVYVARGTKVVVLDPATLAVDRSWEVEKRVTGLQLAADGTRLYVGLRDEIVILDPKTGKVLGVLDPAGVGAFGVLGESTPALEEERTEIECAC